MWGDMVKHAGRILSGMCLISTGVDSVIRSDPCRRLWPHQCGTEKRRGTWGGVSACCEFRVWCDVDQSAVSEREGGNFFESPVTSPVAAPRAKVNVFLTSQAQFQEVKKAWKDPGEKKRGWSLQLKLKYHLGKQTGFPPVVTHPRHPCRFFLPVTSHPSASDPAVAEPFAERTTL